MRIRTLARAALVAACLATIGCQYLIEQTDRDVAALIRERQRTALDYDQPAPLGDAGQKIPTPSRDAYLYAPDPATTTAPADFTTPAGRRVRQASTAPATQPGVPAPESKPGPAPPVVQPATQPPSQPGRSETAPTAAATGASETPPGETPPVTLPAWETAAATVPTTQYATRGRAQVFTLTDALAYALKNRREYQTAKEDLYLVALALTLERHLWTPIFASTLRTVYGNYGEVRDFDQAMRFVADLGVAQRLPYGGEFTAQAVSTLIRDVKQSITAAEGSAITLGLNVPLLKGAGHVAQEELIQLERELTYAVRAFERFRRAQLVDVAQAYFELLRSKQTVIDTYTSFQNRVQDFEKALAFEQADIGALLDTQRAEQSMLTAQNGVEQSREQFRQAADLFKLLLGMPVDEPLLLDDLEDIESIERLIAAGRYPVLIPPIAAGDEARAVDVATQKRYDLLTAKDRIDDAKRGVAIAENALLPQLDWNSTVTWDTDPSHYRLADFSYDRTTWRSELLLELPIERTAERNAFRRAIIDVHRAERQYVEQTERVRAEVRRAVNQIRLNQRSYEIQERNLQVAERRREYARIRFDQGDFSNRDVIEAEDEWTQARNGLNQAKTALWNAILEFRLTTETLNIEDDGRQIPDGE
jgi:outer membrane protein TolC